MSDETDAAELQARKRPLLEEIVEINGLYGCGKVRERSPEDVARSAALWAEMKRLDDEYDAAHPHPPCAVCGAPISASLATGGWKDRPCQRIAQCPNAPSVIGG